MQLVGEDLGDEDNRSWEDRRKEEAYHADADGRADVVGYQPRDDHKAYRDGCAACQIFSGMHEPDSLLDGDCETVAQLRCDGDEEDPADGQGFVSVPPKRVGRWTHRPSTLLSRIQRLRRLPWLR